MKIDAVNAIIFDQYHRILLTLRQDLPMWNLPGGGVEEGEESSCAILREISEELAGLTVTPVRKLGIYKNLTLNRIAQTFIFSTIYSDDLTIIQPKDEEIKWRFFSKEELPANIWPRHKRRIFHAFDGLSDMHEEENVDEQQEMHAIPLESYIDLDYWLAHPAVLKNKENGIIRYWPLSE